MFRSHGFRALSLVSHHEIKRAHFAAMKEDEPGIILTREGRAIFLRAYEKKLRTVNRYVEGKHSYRRTLAYRRVNMHRHCSRRMRRCTNRLR